MKNGGGHFELESGGHFKLELGGQYHWNLHIILRKLIIDQFLSSKTSFINDRKEDRSKSTIKSFALLNSNLPLLLI